jgi:pimeloyl-ACP methyl ester carboxylesterase
LDTYRASDGAALGYEISGPKGGIPLILVHGWQTDGSTWGPLRSLLELKHRVVVPDLRGSGASNRAPGPYRVERFASDLTDLIADLDLDPAVVIGHSMGAAVALRFAIDRPEALEGLVLVAPVPASGLPLAENVRAFLRSTPGNPELGRVWLGRLLGSNVEPHLFKLVRDAAATVSREAGVEMFDDWTALDFGDEAATIVTPTLVVAGANDRPQTPDFIRTTVVEPMENAEQSVFDGAGHFVQVDAAERLAHAIDAFVEDL